MEFHVIWQIENVNPNPNDKSPDGIYACREDKSGAVLYNTAGDVNHSLRVEVQEVVPVPNANAAAALLANGTLGPGTMRPPLDPAKAWLDGGIAKTKAQLAYGSELNALPNPAVIPILPADTAADGTNCALFQVTYYWPKDMNFTEDDTRLVWSITGKGNGKFFGRKNGRIVMIHGTDPGEVNIEVRFNNTQVAVYRALVAPLVTIPYRATILYGDPTSAQLRPKSTPASIATQVLICNRFIWQLGITLQPFKSATIGWHPAAVPAANITPVGGQTGLFQADVPPAWTRNDTTIDMATSAAINSLPYVFNFVYVVFAGASNDGAGCLMEMGGADTITDSGTPSTSWKRHCGVNPDEEAEPVTMTRIPKYAMFSNALYPHRFAMYVSDQNPDPAYMGNVIAHELGHVLGLNHRVEHGGGYDDKVNYPPRENVMYYASTPDISQDFDILQAKQVRLSPLLSPPAGGRPAPDP